MLVALRSETAGIARTEAEARGQEAQDRRQPLAAPVDESAGKWRRGGTSNATATSTVEAPSGE